MPINVITLTNRWPSSNRRHHPHHQVTPSSSLLYARLLAVLIANGTTYLTSLHCIPSLYLYILYFIFYILYFIFYIFLYYFWHLKDYPMNCNACAMSSSWLLFAGREYSFVSLIKIFKWKFELFPPQRRSASKHAQHTQRRSNNQHHITTPIEAAVGRKGIDLSIWLLIYYFQVTTPQKNSVTLQSIMADTITFVNGRRESDYLRLEMYLNQCYLTMHTTHFHIRIFITIYLTPSLSLYNWSLSDHMNNAGTTFNPKQLTELYFHCFVGALSEVERQSQGVDLNHKESNMKWVQYHKHNIISNHRYLHPYIVSLQTSRSPPTASHHFLLLSSFIHWTQVD